VEVQFDKSFEKNIDRINDSKILERIRSVVLECEESKSINDIHNIKKMSGYSYFYRIKMGKYRIGVEFKEKSIIRFITVKHRKDIHKKFP
jgi:mRNA interferase RelE/StbE